MNFFAAQQQARRNTMLLVVLFCLAIIALVLITNILVMVVLAISNTGMMSVSVAQLSNDFQWDLFWPVALGVSTVIGLGSLYKMAALSSGGRAVAESLGGVIVPQNSQDAVHLKILNVVEEMAIASGTPVPTIYLLDEAAINAFAAGWSPNSAVIGITRGAVTLLSRDELQGVVAHEFSHIFNGDMRLNIRLTGVLHGILLLGMIGYYLLRSIRHISSSRDRNGGQAVAALAALGVGLVVIGYVGTFFGQWIKAVVSRQREFLADASAVQFTRNKDGIADALKKIGGSASGSRLLAPAAPEYSHAYFAQGISSLMGFLFATHPPLAQRIKRLDRSWNGRFLAPQRDVSLEASEPVTKQDQQQRREALLASALSVGAGAAVIEVLDAIDNIGNPDQQQFGYARNLLQEIPEKLRQEIQDPYGARGVIYCLVMNHDAETQALQWQYLQDATDLNLYHKTREIFTHNGKLPARWRLPIFDLCFPALRQLSKPQYELFRHTLQRLIKADNKVDLGEWIVQRLVVQRLDEAHGLRKPAKSTYSHIGAVKPHAELIMSMLAYAEHQDPIEAQQAFTAGIKAIGATALHIVPKAEISLAKLDTAMDELEKVKPLIKPRLLKALVACVNMDGEITLVGIELLRALSSALDCPLPPIPVVTNRG